MIFYRFIIEERVSCATIFYRVLRESSYATEFNLIILEYEHDNYARK